MSQSVLTPSLLEELGERVAALSANLIADGSSIGRVSIGELADGSMRAFALVSTLKSGREFRFRISAPASAGAPSWASTEWTTEIEGYTGWKPLTSVASSGAVLVGDDDALPHSRKWDIIERSGPGGTWNVVGHASAPSAMAALDAYRVECGLVDASRLGSTVGGRPVLSFISEGIASLSARPVAATFDEVIATTHTEIIDGLWELLGLFGIEDVVVSAMPGRLPRDPGDLNLDEVEVAASSLARAAETASVLSLKPPESMWGRADQVPIHVAHHVRIPRSFRIPGTPRAGAVD